MFFNEIIVDLTLILPLVGVVVGILAGFFGIGGGIVLVPTLLSLGFEMKAAIGISIVQMVFASIYGSILNFKNGSLDMKIILPIGVGGFFGALISPYFVNYIDSIVLEFLFLAFVFFALGRLYWTTHEMKVEKEVSKTLLFAIGSLIGFFSISIGVGGSVLLVPLLVGFLHVSLKKAISAGLFFVVFSSVSGLVGLSLTSSIDYEHGILVGAGSLIGVAIGIRLKGKVSSKLQKKLLILMYFGVAVYLFIRLVKEVL